ncbi:hypothetical protein E0K89_007150 [Aquicoccus sp. SCR17]|nr:hypothetical protein [Carideicomes alvinocaridis]
MTEPSAMIRLVYISRASREIPALEVVELLSVSRRNNAAAGLTGLLVLHDGMFFQCLEGPGGAVDRCLDRIRSDDRHRAVMPLVRDRVAARMFPDWQMGYVRPRDMPAEALQEMRDLAHLLQGGAGPPAAAGAGVCAGPVAEDKATLLLRSLLSGARGRSGVKPGAHGGRPEIDEQRGALG